MSAPAPRFTTRQEYRDLNRRMAEAILEEEPAPYVDGGYVRRVLEIRGRRSGAVHQVALAVVCVGGGRYVVSPVRDRNWVENLLADPACVIRSRDTSEPAHAEQLDDATQIADVVATYLAKMDAPWAIAQFPFPPDAPRDRIAAEAARLAVFRLEAAASRPSS